MKGETRQRFFKAASLHFTVSSSLQGGKQATRLNRLGSVCPNHGMATLDFNAGTTALTGNRSSVVGHPCLSGRDRSNENGAGEETQGQWGQRLGQCLVDSLSGQDGCRIVIGRDRSPRFMCQVLRQPSGNL